MASIFRKPGGKTWWVTYYLDGKRFRQSLRTRDERIARRKLKKLEGDLISGELERRTVTPVAPFLEAFCDHLATTRTRKSLKNDLAYVRGFFGPICDALKHKSTINHRFRPAKPIRVRDHLAKRHVTVATLEQVTPALVDGFITTRIRKDGIAPKTANRTREVLHVLFNYAIRQFGFRSTDRRFPNPVDAVARRKEDDPRIRFLTMKQITQQLHILGDHPVIQVMVALYIYAGLRREEGLWLTGEDVDLRSRMIRIRKKTVAGETWRPKTRRNRRVPISSALLRYLKAYDPPCDTPWFFPSSRRKRWDPDNFSQTLRETNRAHGIPWSCLDFRHTFGSHLAMKGESLYKISALMGNSPDICRRHYAALMPEEMRDTVEFDVRPGIVPFPKRAADSA